MVDPSRSDEDMMNSIHESKQKTKKLLNSKGKLMKGIASNPSIKKLEWISFNSYL